MTRSTSNLRPMPFRVRAELFQKLTQLEHAGIPYDRAAKAIDLPPKYRDRIELMQSFAAKGIDASLAGEKSAVFTRMEARLIRAALQSGSPLPTYRRLASHYTLRAQQQASMRSKLALPAVMLFLAVLIQPLPKLVTGTLTTGAYLWQAIRPFLVIGGAVWLYRQLGQTGLPPAGKSWQQYVPIWRGIFVRKNLRDFFESLSLMLEAGVSMLDALPAAVDVVEDGDIRRELSKIRMKVERGAPFAVALQGLDYAGDGRVAQFAYTGELSGTLSEMLGRHADMESEELDAQYAQLADWAPKIMYAIVAIYIVVGILGGPGVGPQNRPGMPN